MKSRLPCCLQALETYNLNQTCLEVQLQLRSCPISLQLTSQHPYAEVYIGQPHVWTVDIENSAEVEKAIRSILSQKVKLQHNVL